jgi:hypothetical protein
MDFGAIVQLIQGGALPAVVIVGLAWGYWMERRERIDVTEKRIEREREHSCELRETIAAVQSVTDVLRERIR